MTSDSIVRSLITPPEMTDEWLLPTCILRMNIAQSTTSTYLMLSCEIHVYIRTLNTLSNSFKAQPTRQMIHHHSPRATSPAPRFQQLRKQKRGGGKQLDFTFAYSPRPRPPKSETRKPTSDSDSRRPRSQLI